MKPTEKQIEDLIKEAWNDYDMPITREEAVDMLLDLEKEKARDRK